MSGLYSRYKLDEVRLMTDHPSANFTADTDAHPITFDQPY